MAPRRCCAKTCFNAQMNTRDVTYFGFPKSQFYAHKWAVAAGREDLLQKQLNTLTKYHLCSEHFTDNCFFDPPANTQLRKTSRPVKVPIPTIFKNNISKFYATAKRQEANAYSDQNKLLKRTNCERSENEANEMTTTTTILVIPEPWTMTTIPSVQTENQNIALDAAPNSESTETVEFYLESQSDEEKNDCMQQSKDVSKQIVCRLCSCSFDNDQLIDIFMDDDIAEIVEFVLPGEVRRDDEYSKLICSICLEKANHVVQVIKGFREAQISLKLDSIIEEVETD